MIQVTLESFPNDPKYCREKLDSPYSVARLVQVVSFVYAPTLF
jgi:hypothetical protein